MTSKFNIIIPVAVVLYLAALAVAKPTYQDDPESTDLGGDIQVANSYSYLLTTKLYICLM